ncbi:MAG TPA: DUF1566 domain-containing protein [Syntrophales bacterium]|nr:DUF1566 domain-containing protein [Syntrophales bacterium]
MKKYLLFLIILILALGATASSRAELVDMGDGTIYDTDLDITWYKNPNNTYMTWNDAMAWARGLSVGGHRDWRLPSTPGTEEGYVHEGEMGHLYYDTLDNDDDGPLANKGPFPGLQPYDYWCSTEFDEDPADFAWAFDFATGTQRAIEKNGIAYGLAVRGGGGPPQRTSPGEQPPAIAPGQSGGDETPRERPSPNY